MKGRDGLVYYLRPMRREDMAQVGEIEREAFSTMGPPTPFRRELDNRLVRYLVVVQETGSERRPVLRMAAVRQPRTFFRWLKRLARTILFPDEITEGMSAEFLVGYVGVWFMADEAHITAIAVRSTERGQGIGELLLMGTIELAMRRRARVVTLESRVSNAAALALYEKYEFRRVGLRRGYYSDNNEDALIMTTDPITSPPYQERFHQMMARFRERRGEPLWTFA